MKSIQRVALKDKEDIRWEAINCALLDADFFKIVWSGNQKKEVKALSGQISDNKLESAD